MGLTQTRQLILLGFLLVGPGVVGLYDAVVVTPACTWILSDVRVCEPNLSSYPQSTRRTRGRGRAVR